MEPEPFLVWIKEEVHPACALGMRSCMSPSDRTTTHAVFKAALDRAEEEGLPRPPRNHFVHPVATKGLSVRGLILYKADVLSAAMIKKRGRKSYIAVAKACGISDTTFMRAERALADCGIRPNTLEGICKWLDINLADVLV